MRRSFSVAALGFGLMNAACSFTYDWRQAHVAVTGLEALLPCEPAQATRAVPLGEDAAASLPLHMLGCKAGRAGTYLDLEAAVHAFAVLACWKAVTPISQGADGVEPDASRALACASAGANVVLAPLRLAVAGQRPGGEAVQARLAWFAHGARLYQAMVLAERPDAQVVDAFFSELRLP